MLTYVMSNRLNPRHNRKVLLHVISGHEGNVVCVIKMLLISAMRLGAIQGTIEEILAKTAARRDKTLQWADGRGSSPVLCGFGAAQLVIVDKPAMINQLRDTVHKASLLAGILKPIVPHDMRRGSAKDIANLPRDPTRATGLGDSVVAAELGHSNTALQKGVTANYVGATTDDSWTRRVSADVKDLFGPGTASEAYKKPKTTRVQWGTMYNEAGVDPSDRKATRNLRNETHKQNEDQWRLGGGETQSPRPGASFISLSFIAQQAAAAVLTPYSSPPRRVGESDQYWSQRP
jgi:hypothetical protein